MMVQNACNQAQWTCSLAVIDAQSVEDRACLDSSNVKGAELVLRGRRNEFLDIQCVKVI